MVRLLLLLAVGGLAAAKAPCKSHDDCNHGKSFCAAWGVCALCTECHHDHDAVDKECPKYCSAAIMASRSKAPQKPLIEVDKSKLDRWGIDISLFELLGEDGVPELLPQTYDKGRNLEALPGLKVNLALESFNEAARIEVEHLEESMDERDGDEDEEREHEQHEKAQVVEPTVAHGAAQGKGRASRGGLADAELQALLDLYAATGGADGRWRGGVKWEQNSASSACDGAWRGVQCVKSADGVAHVEHLSLESIMSPGGTLPASLARLSHLISLDIGSNGLTGTLPPQLASMRRLQHLEADGNSFVGEIPESFKAFRDLSRGGPRSGAAAGGARVFLGFNTHPDSSKTRRFGFVCPYPAFLQQATRTQTKGSTVATGWGIARECGLRAQDATPDEEEPLPGDTGGDSVQAAQEDDEAEERSGNEDEDD